MRVHRQEHINTHTLALSRTKTERENRTTWTEQKKREMENKPDDWNREQVHFDGKNFKECSSLLCRAGTLIPSTQMECACACACVCVRVCAVVAHHVSVCSLRL